MNILEHEVRTKGNVDLEYFRYTEKGTGRPQGKFKVGDKVTVTHIKVLRAEFPHQREVLGTEEAEIVRLVHRIKHTYLWKYRDTFYKVQLASGKFLWLNGGFNHHIYHR